MSFTTNKNLEEPARGAYVGTWDTPVNSNTTIIDNSLGGVATVALTNSNVTLSAGQYQCVFLNFTGAISANIAITLPAVGSFYTVQNLTSNTSAFYITMTTTAVGGEAIGIPPGTPTDIFTDGTNVRFRNLGTVNKYEDWAVSSSPSWLAACTKPPYLNCDGTSFSSATYPVTTVFLGGTTLPDSRGRFRATLNQGQSRITSTGAGSQLDANTILASGGAQAIAQANLPNVSWTKTGQVLVGGSSAGLGVVRGSGATTVQSGFTYSLYLTANYGTITDTLAFTSGGADQGIVPPSYAGGLTFLRSA